MGENIAGIAVNYLKINWNSCKIIETKKIT